MSSKESAEGIANIAEQRGYQTISFDLPGHGERKNEDKRCDIWNGIHDLTIIGDYVFTNWKEVSLYACSLGAYFCLNAYNTRNIKKCLFQSPILDMEYLIKQMMVWFEISEERLAREKEIETPIDMMTWDYYQYVKDFVHNFNCALTLSENSEHPFMAEEDGPIVEQWLQDNL